MIIVLQMLSSGSAAAPVEWLAIEHEREKCAGDYLKIISHDCEEISKGIRD